MKARNGSKDWGVSNNDKEKCLAVLTYQVFSPPLLHADCG